MAIFWIFLVKTVVEAIQWSQPFKVFKLLFGWREGYLAYEKFCAENLQQNRLLEIEQDLEQIWNNLPAKLA